MGAAPNGSTYTVKEAAKQIGASVSWVRKQIRAGNLQPTLYVGKHGQQYGFTEADLDAARGLYHARKRKTDALVVHSEESERLQQAIAAIASAQATAESERLRAERAEQSLATAQQRIESLKAMGVLDRLLGRHKRV